MKRIFTLLLGLLGLACSANAQEIPLELTGGWGWTKNIVMSGEVTVTSSNQWAEFKLSSIPIQLSVYKGVKITFSNNTGNWQIRSVNASDQGEYLAFIGSDGVFEHTFNTGSYGDDPEITTFELQHADNVEASITIEKVELISTDDKIFIPNYAEGWGCSYQLKSDNAYSGQFTTSSQWAEIGGSNWKQEYTAGQQHTFTLKLNSGAPDGLQLKVQTPAGDKYPAIAAGTTEFSYDLKEEYTSVSIQNTKSSAVTLDIASMTVTITEAIPPSTYKLGITASGKGSASYSGTTIRGETTTFTFNEGASATIIFTPDTGYRIANVKVNNTDVTANVRNNQITISSISANTMVSVTFEAVPSSTLGTESNPYTVSQAHALIQSLGADVESEEICVKGFISQIDNISPYPETVYGNATYWISDVKGSTAGQLEVYRGYSIGGEKFSSKDEIKEGDEVVVKGKVVNYRGNTPEFTSGSIIYSLNGQASIGGDSDNIPGTLARPFTPAEANAFILQMEAGVNSTQDYYIKGKIIDIEDKNQFGTQYGNCTFYISDDDTDKDDKFYVYRTLYLGNEKYSDDSWPKPKAGDEVIICGKVVNYKGNTPETVQNQSYIYSLNGQTSIGGDSDTPGTLARPFTPAEANAFILQMEAGVNSTQDYYIKGKIIDIEDKNQFGTQYGNCTFYISDDGTDKDDKFYVYRTLYLGNKKYEDDSWTKPKAGDEVIICGKVVNYKGNTPETVQNQSYIYSLNGKTEIGEGDDITQFITATSLGGAITQTNNLINSGSQLNWNFSNKSTYKVLLKSLQLIDGQTGSWGNVMTIDQFVEAGTSVSYTTTIGSSGIHTPVTCHFIYDYNGTEYSVDAKFSSSLGNCTLSIESTGNGSITYNGTIIRNETKDFSVENGSAVTLTFTPDAGCQLLNVQEGNLNVTSAVTNNSYLVMIIGNTTVSVTFSGVPTDISSEGMKYTVSSYNNKTVSLAKGNYGPVLKVPATIDAEGATWTVVGIDEGAFTESPYLAAIIWNPTVPFTETVSNPNLLLYVNDAEYAPSSVKNVVVNDKATSITLTDAANGNDFYCPREFTAEQISYTHRYEMTTGIEESRGWETIALPFDVDRVEHSTKGTVVPFASWNTSSVTKPFWLYQYGSGGFTEATVIRANTPYIISMPNNEQYLAAYRLNGTVTFSASNATVKATDEAITANNGDMSFVPCFSVRQAQTNDYALNVNNELASNSSTVVEGSRFIRNSRVVHPFEAYFTTSAQNARPFIPVFEDVPTGIKDVPLLGDRVQGNNAWYTLDGRKLNGKPVKSGVYLYNGKKAVVR